MTGFMRRIALLLLLCAIFAWESALGQVGDDLNLKLEKSVFLEEATSTGTNSAPYLLFPRIGDYPLFDGDKYTKRIDKAEKEDDLFALDSLLTNFIGQWGAENFTVHVDYLWKAGQVKELLGDTAAANLYYELGLKNQRPHKKGITS